MLEFCITDVRERFNHQHVRFYKSTDDYQEWKRSRDGDLSKAIRSEEEEGNRIKCFGRN